jgi:hypothetical protein
VTVLAACDARRGYDDAEVDAAEEIEAPPVPRAARSEAPGGAAYAVSSSAFDGASSPDTEPGPQVPVDPASVPMLVRTGDALLEVDSLEAAIDALRSAVAAAGGYVGNVRVVGGETSRRSATLEAKVPSEGFEALIGALDPIGDLERLSVQAEDVGEEFVDVQARLANAERLESRLLALLERPGSDLADVLAVEREIARVRESAERLEGRLRYLRSRADLATLSVTLREPASFLGTRPGATPFRDAFRGAARNLLGVVVFLIGALGVILPLAIVLAVLALVALRLKERFGSIR